jgi:hypothetical protein
VRLNLNNIQEHRNIIELSAALNKALAGTKKTENDFARVFFQDKSSLRFTVTEQNLLVTPFIVWVAWVFADG